MQMLQLLMMVLLYSVMMDTIRVDMEADIQEQVVDILVVSVVEVVVSMEVAQVEDIQVDLVAEVVVVMAVSQVEDIQVDLVVEVVVVMEDIQVDLKRVDNLAMAVDLMMDSGVAMLEVQVVQTLLRLLVQMPKVVHLVNNYFLFYVRMN